MRALTAEELLAIWELGESQPPGQRALTLLAAACDDDAPAGQLAQLSIGQRDVCLLALRERTFGPQLASMTACPACGELLEFGINAAAIRAAPVFQPPGTFDLEHADYAVQFRLPNSHDLANLDLSADVQLNRQRLFKRCVLTSRHAGEEISAEELPPGVVAAVSEQMAQADPNADVQIALTCSRCAHHWQAPFDILSCFWSEINAWAIRLLHEVHTLASVYGWREVDILSMSPKRRQTYLELVNP
jgi:hypothetical protein